MKRLWGFFWSWQREHPRELGFAATLLAAGAVVLHFSTFAGLLFDYGDSIGVISAFDNDSAYGIETSEKTWLVNHNGSPMYGPVYYRLGAVYRTLLENDYAPASLSDSQKRERSVFFHMMLINLIALYAGAFLILWCLTDSRFFQLIGTVVLVAAILRDEWRSHLLFMVKPEHLFAALMTGVGFLTLRWLAMPAEEREEGRALKTWAAAWAVAASTKLSVIFFVPGLLSFWLPWRRPSRASLSAFAKWVAIFYLIVGFPQNLDVVGYVKYLLQQSAHTRLISWDFLRNDWLPLFGRDLVTPALFLIGMFVWMPLRERGVLALTKEAAARFALYLALSIAFLFSKEIPVPHQWYSFPMVNQLWLLLAFGLVEASIVLSRRWAVWQRWASWRHHALFPFAVLAVLPFVFEAFPRRVFAAHGAGMECRPEIRRMQARIDQSALAGKRLLVDPYVPADFKISRSLRTVKGAWQMDWAQVADFRADILAFKEPYGRSLLGSPNLPAESRAFYAAFLGGASDVTAPDGAIWRLVHREDCGFAVWEK